MPDEWKHEISKHKFVDEDVNFKFATDDGVCLEFCNDKSEESLSGVLYKSDVIALAKRLGVTINDLIN